MKNRHNGRNFFVINISKKKLKIEKIIANTKRIYIKFTFLFKKREKNTEMRMKKLYFMA